MDHDYEHGACASCDLLAQLTGERNRTRQNLRAAELQLARIADLVIDGSIDCPVSLVQQMQNNRQQLLAIEQVLADLLGYGACHAASA